MAEHEIPPSGRDDLCFGQIRLLYKVETMADEQNLDYQQRAELLSLIPVMLKDELFCCQSHIPFGHHILWSFFYLKILVDR